VSAHAADPGRRVGAIDIGTNSIRLLVCDVAAGEISEVERLLTITRLGDGVDASGTINAAALERAYAALSGYAERAAQLGAERVLAVATSAVRDASNGRELLAEIERRYGFETRLLTGDEEARTTFRGVTSRRQAGEGTLICDIGGGSTEFVLGDSARVLDQISLDIGCVRMSERFLAQAPPPAEAVANLRAAVAAVIPRHLTDAAKELIGVAGTITTLATIDLGLESELPEVIDGHVLTAATVERLLSDLGALSLDELKQVRGLMPARAVTIVAGAAILAEVVAAADTDAVTVSERDILHGAALIAAE
jgi:exopolyphosphatase/guanosine-5'-triphosphate,3'-diphosphate pyrophosphatase